MSMQNLYSWEKNVHVVAGCWETLYIYKLQVRLVQQWIVRMGGFVFSFSHHSSLISMIVKKALTCILGGLCVTIFAMGLKLYYYIFLFCFVS